MEEQLEVERKMKEAAYREIDAWRKAETPRAYYQFGPTDTRSGLIPHVVGGSVESITALRKLVEEK